MNHDITGAPDLIAHWHANGLVKPTQTARATAQKVPSMLTRALPRVEEDYSQKDTAVYHLLIARIRRLALKVFRNGRNRSVSIQDRARSSDTTQNGTHTA